MNGYIEKALLQFQHPKPKQHHFAPSTTHSLPMARESNSQKLTRRHQ